MSEKLDTNKGENVARILIVEDDLTLLEMYQTKFEMEGYEIATAVNGEECLKTLETFPADLILLDILMPKVNGFHVLKEIKKKSAWRHIPVILLTNLGEPEVDLNKDLAQALGVSDYLIKSRHTPDEVVAKAAQVMKGEATESSDEL